MKHVFLVTCIGLLFACSEGMKEKGKKEPEQISVSDIKENHIKKITQHYQISNSDTTIICNGGTKILLNKNSFVTMSGEEVTGNIDLFVVECLTMSDIILSGLTSVLKDGKFLETSGMVRMQAFSNEKPLKISQTTNDSIQFPYYKNNSVIFSGRMNDQADVVWDSHNLSFMGFWDETGNMVILESSLSQPGSEYFSLDTLGWINLDRFKKFDESEDLIVTADLDHFHETYARCVLSQYDIVIPPTIIASKKEIIFKGIPSNEPFTIVLINSNGKNVRYCIDDFGNVNGKKKINMKYKTGTEEDLKQSLAGKFKKIRTESRKLL